ncbi:hypothetical protein AV530_015295 [Patagioenas fasciata monilis]|uniref:Uncharacterized protein n=1 Tax=Patagioenas fasciata monilis TaxID=372326 RepID=A0A1V4K1T7_PATFA|nr:hypothetical protein AV530_015295 [Patagioenas fasciata monilis]
MKEDAWEVVGLVCEGEKAGTLVQRACCINLFSQFRISRARDLLRDAWPHLESMLRRNEDAPWLIQERGGSNPQLAGGRGAVELWWEVQEEN